MQFEQLGFYRYLKGLRPERRAKEACAVESEEVEGLTLELFLAPEEPDTLKVQEKTLALTSYLSAKLQLACESIDSSIFQHLCIAGPESSGKISFTEILASRLSFLHKMVVVTMEQTFETKNLVGTYVCDELGSFSFKKGPLTVAAEQGLWLVIRDIDQCPSDLLSFLLPLIRDNLLKVTATQSIVPKFGFRIIALTQKNPTDSSSLEPLLNQMQLITLDAIEGRLDSQQLFQKLYPNLLKNKELS